MSSLLGSAESSGSSRFLRDMHRNEKSCFNPIIPFALPNDTAEMSRLAAYPSMK